MHTSGVINSIDLIVAVAIEFLCPRNIEIIIVSLITLRCQVPCHLLQVIHWKIKSGLISSR